MTVLPEDRRRYHERCVLRIQSERSPFRRPRTRVRVSECAIVLWRLYSSNRGKETHSGCRESKQFLIGKPSCDLRCLRNPTTKYAKEGYLKKNSNHTHLLQTIFQKCSRKFISMQYRPRTVMRIQDRSQTFKDATAQCPLGVPGPSKKKSTSKNTHDCSRMFWNIQDHSQTFKNVAERRTLGVPGPSKKKSTFKNTQDCSRKFMNIQDRSQTCKIVYKHSRSFTHIQVRSQTFKNVAERRTLGVRGHSKKKRTSKNTQDRSTFKNVHKLFKT
ncbi:unnamed protein product [Nesidiocoris tenuis]|uniref:Uncharacterized protein n=1 Tax=Nesidiocoris tenuis TaxID=355587 RepID=A0A6H5GA27_9HEMI|nr:unnamed protein product [Nesidiocoris tenuis]